jgi:WD40 repeat protein
VYPINAVAFHPIFGKQFHTLIFFVCFYWFFYFIFSSFACLQAGTFATGGCDGIVNVWDGKNKKRLTQVRRYPTSVAALSFNHDGTQLAIASSYTHFRKVAPEGLKEQIFIRNVLDSDAMPKAKQFGV